MSAAVPSSDRPATDQRTSRVGRVIWLTTTVLVVLAFLASLTGAVQVARDIPHVLGVPTIVLVSCAFVTYVLLSVALLASLAWLAGRQPRLALAVALVVFVVVRVGLVAAVDAPLVSAWLGYHQLALGALQGAPILADVPMGFPILLAEAYRLGGVSIASGEALNVVASLLTGVLLAAWIWRAAGGRAAALSVGILAIMPSQVFFTALLGSETVYGACVVAFAFLLTEVLAALQSGEQRRAIFLMVPAGVILGLSEYVRTTSLVVVPLVAVLPVIAGVGWRRAVPVAVATVLGVAVALVPAAAANWSILDRWSVSTSTYLGWQLYIGANTSSDGQYNGADIRRVDASGGGVANIPAYYAAGDFDPAHLQVSARRDEIALRLALARIRTSLTRLPALVPLKFDIVWARADNAVQWVVGPRSDQSDPRAPDWTHGVGAAVAGFALVWAQLSWIGVLGLAAYWYIRERRSPTIVGIVVGTVLIPVAAALLILEAQSRYHEYAVPLLVGIAAIALSDLVPRLQARRGRPPHPGEGSVD